MNGITDPAPVVCAVILGNDNGCTGRKPDEKADEQVDNGGSRAPDGGKGFLADKVADDDGIRSVIELLENVPNKIGKKKIRSCFQMTPSVI